MIRRQLIFFILLAAVGCGQAPEKQLNSDTARSVKHAVTKDQIMGIWTDGSTGNATFEIKQDSIYYVEYGKSFKYDLNKGIITIHYPDNYTYNGKVRFLNDTMIMRSKEKTDEPSRFWKFKN